MSDNINITDAEFPPQVAMQGCLDSVKDDMIAGWVQCDDSASPLVAVLIEEGSIRGRLCRRSGRSGASTNQLEFLFDRVTDETLMKLVVGTAWIVCVRVSGSKMLAAATGSQWSGDEDLDGGTVDELRGIVAGHSYKIPVFKKFEEIAMNKVASERGLNISFGAPAELVAQALKTYDAWPVLLSTSIREGSQFETSSFELPVGAISRDTSVIVGRSGHLFLYKGNNYLLDQYVDSDEAKSCAYGWEKIVDRREKMAKKVGSQFIQVFIPEKSTILHELFPDEIDIPAYSIRYINERIGGLPFVFDMTSMISSHEQAKVFYRKTDSHFSYVGCEAAFRAIVARLGLSPPQKVDMDSTYIFRGDLGRRFPGVVEKLAGPTEKFATSLQPEIVLRKIPEDGRHEGMTFIWKNERAVYQQKVVVFGNSFFGPGDHAHELSWWFSRYFQEFHFIWSRNVDFEYVNSVAPDIIVAQSIERFLLMVPKT